jgi:Uma2 family endonuclease
MATTAEDLVKHHRFTVEDYRRMGESGIFHEDDRVELIEGEVVEMTPIGSPHSGTNIRIHKRLEQAVGERAIVSSQNPITLDEFSEPQPDIALLRPRDDFYSRSHPTPADVLLLIEICESSLRYDREVKLPLYACHGIPAVWLVDLQESHLIQFSQPAHTGYQTVDIADIGRPLSLPALADLAVDLRGLF